MKNFMKIVALTIACYMLGSAGGWIAVHVGTVGVLILPVGAVLLTFATEYVNINRRSYLTSWVLGSFAMAIGFGIAH